MERDERPYNPPLSPIILSSIHDVAEPQTISFSPSAVEAQLFQKRLKAVRNLDLGVSIQGNSSKNTTIRFLRIPDRKSFSWSKASNQVFGKGLVTPLCSAKAFANRPSCIFIGVSKLPVKKKSNFS